MSDLKVIQHDNRGDSDVPHGYVYFSDGSRLGYAKVEETKDTDGLFVTHPGVWDSAETPTHFKLAKEYLHEQHVTGW